MLSRDAAIEAARDLLLPAMQRQRARIDELDRWYRWDQEALELPSRATEEHKALERLAHTPWLGLVVTNVSQALYVDGYRSPNDPERGENARPWRAFRANRLHGGQVAIHRAALAYGITYGTALPGIDPVTGEPMTRLQGVSPRKMVALYSDPTYDEWPELALRVGRSADGSMLLRVYDEEAEHFIGVEAGKPTYIEARIHGANVPPVVRWCNQLDLDGRTPGEVEPFIPLAQRINKTTYDRLLTQHYNSWKVRWATGLEEEDDDDAEAAKLRQLRQNDLLVSDSPDTKFGTLPETPLDGLIKAEEQSVKMLAAVSQTPVHAMVGDLVNLSAEALAAARAQLEAKVTERQHPFGESWAQWLRLHAHMTGDGEAATDFEAHVTWADTSIRSLATAADALGKFATMLNIPVEALWSHIPGVTRDDVEEWRQMRAASERQAEDAIDRELRQLVPPVNGAGG